MVTKHAGQFENIISKIMDERGWSRINCAHEALLQFMDYVNDYYTDNGHRLVLRDAGYVKALEEKR